MTLSLHFPPFYRNMNENEVRVLPLMKSFLLQGNPLTCNCELRPLIGWALTNKNNLQVVENHRLEVYIVSHIMVFSILALA